MAEGNFSDFIAQERERLRQEREAALAQQRELQQQLAGIDKELSAIGAYEAAKTGKTARASSSGHPRATRRGSKREDLIRLINDADGLSRGEIIDRMGLRGDKSGEMSVSNALTALTKNGQVRRDGGKYYQTV
ncbi:MAG: hypothetical protein JO001_16195 [Alphaproteobacteria bacterium]|nr:hypothetical protein [Alphaproteobacteria bacterium]